MVTLNMMNNCSNLKFNPIEKEAIVFQSEKLIDPSQSPEVVLTIEQRVVLNMHGEVIIIM